MGNQGGNVRNKNENLNIAVEMKQESNGNDWQLKEWTKGKIRENEHIRKNLVLHIQFCKIYFQFHF